MAKEMCACGSRLKCEGECREKNLHRKRSGKNPVTVCPSFFTFTERKRRTYDENES